MLEHGGFVPLQSTATTNMVVFSYFTLSSDLKVLFVTLRGSEMLLWQSPMCLCITRNKGSVKNKIINWQVKYKFYKNAKLKK